MRRWSLVIAAGLIVLVANAFALIHAWRNRAGGIDLVMSERELPLRDFYNDDDSSISLALNWSASFAREKQDWLDAPKLAELGFDTSVSPSSPEGREFYGRAPARRAFVALEYNGPAWAAVLANLRKEAIEHPDRAKLQPDPNKSSRLIPIDASVDAAKLQVAHPPGAGVVIVPATIGVYVEQVSNAGQEKSTPRLVGFIRELPSSIHVPLPFSQELRARIRPSGTVLYNVHLRYGTSFEPWIVGFDFTPDDQANRH